MPIKNRIIYYNNGKIISEQELRQPPDLLSPETLQMAMRAVFQTNNIYVPVNAKVIIMQDKIELLTQQYEAPP